ncbi:hypothetical protein M8818_007071 [Zalaria obscura]|uniref:Uncharacterized protein n=1 Tax=Zalaria obscura TaxID=2024903 RepID=A0ACC3S4J8_9PEZI
MSAVSAPSAKMQPAQDANIRVMTALSYLENAAILSTCTASRHGCAKSPVRESARCVGKFSRPRVERAVEVTPSKTLRYAHCITMGTLLGPPFALIRTNLDS